METRQARALRAWVAAVWLCACTGAWPSPNEEARGTLVHSGFNTARRADLPVAPLPRDSIVWFASADHMFPADAIGLQCQGVNDTLVRARVPIPGRQHASNDSVRFGVVRAPDGRRALRLEVDAHDALPSDFPPRCELLGYPVPATALPMGSPFWYAVSMWLGDWATSSDEQIILQWHQDDPRLSLNPFLAVIVRGDRLELVLRHSQSEWATRQNTRTLLAATASAPAGKWTHLILNGTLNPPGSGVVSKLRLWVDGHLLADYEGDLGYRLAAGSLAYAKAGLYHWLNGNQWDRAIPRRSMLIGRAMLVLDSRASITMTAVSAALDNP